MTAYRHNQPEWMLKLKPGDLIARGNQPARVVRGVTRYKDGDLMCVILSILRCSWTTRAYTVKGYTDLILEGYTKVPGRYKFKTKLDKQLERNLRYENRFKQTLDCCDVKDTLR